MNRIRIAVTMAALLASSGAFAQTVVSTSIRAPLVGRLATPAAGQSSIGFYGTDLGFTMKHNGQLRILFGDTWADATGIGIKPPPGTSQINDDSQGMICLQASGCPTGIPFFPNGDAVDLYIDFHPPSFGELSWQREGPPVVFPTSAGKVLPIQLFRAGTTLLESGPFATPGAAFSNARTGADSAAYALFGQAGYLKCGPGFPGCPTGLRCDADIGDWFGGAIQCLRGEVTPDPAFPNDRSKDIPCTVNGACVDDSSPAKFYFPSDPRSVRILPMVRNVEVGNADPTQTQKYFTKQWFTNKFTLPTTTTVNDFEAGRLIGSLSNDFKPPSGATTEHEKVFMWGRPGPIGPQGFGWLYFAFVPMPKFKADASFNWAPQYFSGMSGLVPQFSPNQSDAAPLSLNFLGTPTEDFDITNQMSVRWVDPIKKWVLIYGGDLPSGLLDLATGNRSALVRRDPVAAVHVRFADQPWGPWSAPQALALGGNPLLPVPGTLSGPGGDIYDVFCPLFGIPDCAPHETTAYNQPGVFDIGQAAGFAYGVDIIEEWTMPWPRVGIPLAADIYWVMSTWDPYQVVLMRSRINRL